MLDTIIQTLFYIFALSVVAERIVEAFKGLVGDYLAKVDEKRRAALYQTLTGVFGAILFYIDPMQISWFEQITSPVLKTVLMGVAVSKGSAFWHGIADWAKMFKQPISKENKT